MPDYAYVMTADKFREFMLKIRTVGTPNVANKQFLVALGYKSSNHNRFPGVLKFMEFIDAGNKPTDVWNRWKDTVKGPLVLGNQIKKVYGSLFQLYPNGYELDKEGRRNFFAPQSGLGEVAVGAIVETFKTLCGLAAFGNGVEAAPLAVDQKVPDPSPTVIQAPVTPSALLQGISINVQLTLPETTNSAVYEDIFKAMKKYLIGGD